MKVILLSEVKGRGGEGDIIVVKDGFANNYLIPNKLAVKATPGAIKQLEDRRANIAKREEVRLAEAKETQEKINGLKFKVDVQIGDEGQLFGSVTSQMIADGIKKKTGVEIDKRRIDIRRAIRTVGLHNAEVVVYRDIKANVQVIVGAEDAEKFLADLEAKKSGKKPRADKKGKKDEKAEGNPEDKPAKKADDKADEKPADKPEEKADDKPAEKAEDKAATQTEDKTE